MYAFTDWPVRLFNGLSGYGDTALFISTSSALFDVEFGRIDVFGLPACKDKEYWLNCDVEVFA